MKYWVVLIIMLAAATDCWGQSYSYFGECSPSENAFFRAPAGSKITLTTQLSWSSGNPKAAPPIYPYLDYDSSIITASASNINGFGGEGQETLNIIISSQSSTCLVPPDAGISVDYDSNTGLAYYAIQGVFYDPKVLGKVTGPDSLYFGSDTTHAISNIRMNLRNDSLAQYRQIIVLSVDLPFSLDDSIEMMYRCNEYNDTPNCFFHPTAPGHYVDTAKLLDELTGDTISVVLIGDAYDAGVSVAPAPQVKLFPNPCDRELNIEFPLPEPSEIEIRNMLGELVYSSRATANVAVDCTQFPAGIYFVSINGVSSHQNQKLIVAH